ncbi:MAG TPA: response regulator [Bryobacteraceae bacterium]|jgi:two-component system response regulator|nr:response regulator [Bryobacteraceae bacterium]
MKPAEIVLIEDNVADVLLVQLALEESGISHSLKRYESGADAVVALCESTGEDVPHPDAILLDLNTPRTDGFEALASLRHSPRLSGVPIAILTSSRAKGDKRRAEIQGTRYIEKPSQLDEFLTLIGQAVKEMLDPPTDGAGQA